MEKRRVDSIMLINVFFTSFIVILSCVFDKIYYFIADDYLMNLIIKGAYGGQSDPFLVFNNVILGYIMKGFYSLFPAVNWYPVFQLATVVLIFVIINHSLLKIYENPYEIFLVTGIMELIVVYHLTFTIVSYLCIGAGCVFFLCEELTEGKKERIGWKNITIFSMLFLLGDAWRKSTMLTAIFVFSLLLLYTVLRNKKSMIYFIVAFSVVCVGRFSNNYVYKNVDTSWTSYNEYNVLRSRVIDFPRMNYEEHKEEFKVLDLSRNDVECFYNWIFADKDVFSKKVLEKYVEMQPIRERYNFDFVKICSSMFRLKYNYWFLGVLIITLILLGKGRLMNIGIAMCTYAMIAMLVFRNRVVPRVLIPLYLLGILAMLVWTYSHKRKWKNKYISHAVLGFQIVLVAFSGFCVLRDNRNVKEVCETQTQCYKEVKSYIEKNTDYLFVGSSAVVNPLEYSVDIFSVGEDVNVRNITKLGSWDIYSPRYYEQMSKFHIKNKNSLLKALVEDNVMYMTDSGAELELVLGFLKEHSNQEISYELIEKFAQSDVAIYKICID